MKRHLPDSINIPKLLQNTKPSEWIQEFEIMLMEKLQLRENQSLLATFSHTFKISLMEFFTDNLTMADGFEVPDPYVERDLHCVLWWYRVCAVVCHCVLLPCIVWCCAVAH